MRPKYPDFGLPEALIDLLELQVVKKIISEPSGVTYEEIVECCMNYRLNGVIGETGILDLGQVKTKRFILVFVKKVLLFFLEKKLADMTRVGEVVRYSVNKVNAANIDRELNEQEGRFAQMAERIKGISN